MKKRSYRARKSSVAVFSSFEEENAAEHLRCARMTPSQRLDEFAVLQERAWGERWTKKPMKKTATVERVRW
jgi:hypothetical protein